MPHLKPIQRSSQNTNNNSNIIFEEYSIPRAVLVMAAPTVVTQLISVIYNLADTWFVGRTGSPDMVAALAVVMPIYVMMSALANLFGIGGSSVISRSLGQGNVRKAGETFLKASAGGIISAAAYGLIMLLIRPHIITVIGGDSGSYGYIYDYIFWTMILGVIPTVMNVLLGHLVRSIGFPKQAGLGMSLGGVLNIVLDPLFMFVLLPPGNEVRGAAIATLISNTAACVYFFLFLVKHKNNEVLSHAADILPKLISGRSNKAGRAENYEPEDSLIMKEILMIGLPAALSTTLAMISNMVANHLMSGYGNEAVAGLGIAKKINTIAFHTTMGVTQGVLPLIGYNYGAGRYGRMKKVIYFTGAAALLANLISCACFRGFSAGLVGLFIKDASSVSEGAAFLRIIAFATPLASVCYMFNAAFQATGSKMSAFILSILRKGVLDIPGMFIFGHYIGKTGITYATPVAEIISTTIAVILYLIFLKRLSAEQSNVISS